MKSIILKQITKDISLLAKLLSGSQLTLSKVYDELCSLRQDKSKYVDDFYLEMEKKYSLRNFEISKLINDLAYLITGEHKLTRELLEESEDFDKTSSETIEEICQEVQCSIKSEVSALGEAASAQ